MYRLARFLLDRPVTALALIVAMALVLGSFAPRVRFDFSPHLLFARDAQAEKTLERFRADFGSSDKLLMLVARAERPETLFSPASLRWLRSLAETCEGDAEVVSVQSPLDAPVVVAGDIEDVALQPLVEEMPEDQPGADAVRAVAVKAPLLAGRLVARDATLAVTVCRLDERLEAVEDLKGPVGRIAEAARAIPPPPGIKLGFSGLPWIRVDAVNRLIGDQKVFFPVIAVVFFCVLLLLFRRAAHTLLPLITVLLVEIGMIGLLGILEIPMNLISNILPALLFVVGISDAIHVVARYQQERRGGQDPKPALVNTVSSLAVACALTSLTTAVGFASLVMTSSRVLREFGLLAAVGVLGAWVATVIFLPQGLWLARRARPTGLGPKSGEGASERILEALGRWVMARPVPVVAAGLVLMITSGFFASKVIVDNRLMASFDRDTENAQVYLAVEAQLLGVLPVEIVVEAGEADGALDPELLRKTGELQQFVANLEGIASSVSVLDLLGQLRSALRGGDPKEARAPDSRREAAELLLLAEMSDSGADALATMLSDDRSRLRIAARTRDVGGVIFGRNLGLIEAEIERLGLEARITGSGVHAYAGITNLVRDLFRSLLLAFVVIFFFLFVLFRTPALALLSVVPNVFPLLLTGAVMGALGIPLSVTTVIVFTIALGLAVDDTIHFLHRYREERHLGRSIEDAVVATLRASGRAILFTSVLLVLGFSVLLLSEFPPNRRFAALASVTMFAAVLGDLILLPALLGLAARVQRRRGIAGGSKRA